MAISSQIEIPTGQAQLASSRYGLSRFFRIVIKVELSYNRAGYEGGSMMAMNKHSCLEIEKGAVNDNVLVSELRTEVVES